MIPWPLLRRALLFLLLALGLAALHRWRSAAAPAPGYLRADTPAAAPPAITGPTASPHGTPSPESPTASSAEPRERIRRGSRLPPSLSDVAPPRSVIAGPAIPDTDLQSASPSSTSVPGPTAAPSIPPSQGTSLVGAPLSVSAEPSSFQVVNIPVPSSLPSDRQLAFTVVPDDRTAVLGRKTGLIAPGPESRRSVAITVPVPAAARAGREQVARVRFSAEGAPAVEVPVLLDVAALRRIEITSVAAVHGAQPGGQFDVAYRVTNLGNTADTVGVELQLPDGWRVLGDVRSRLSLPVRVSLTRSFHVAVAPVASGNYTLRLLAISHGATVATGTTAVEILADPMALRGAGPVLTLGTAAVEGPWDGSATAVAATLEGPLTDRIQVSGRAVDAPARADGSLYALSRLGYWPANPSLALWTPTWRLEGGQTSTTLSSLSGTNVWGTGVSASVSGSGWKAATIIAVPNIGGDSVSGELVGGRIEKVVDGLALATSASHLVERQADTRSLEALALGAALPDVFAGTLSTEVAGRRYLTGSGLGWGVSYLRRTPRDNVEVRLTHAPGGSRAFARAAEELQAAASRSLSRRLSVTGSTWRLRDEAGIDFQRIATDGFSLGTQLQAADAVTLGLVGRRSSFSAASAFGRFETAESALEGNLDARRGRGYARAGAMLASASRETVLPSGADLVESAPRGRLSGSLGVETVRGTFEVRASMERSGAGLGLVPSQSMVGIAAQRVPLYVAPHTGIYAEASYTRYSAGLAAFAANAVRAAITMELPQGFSLGLSAERDPYLASVPRMGWIYGVRLSRATRLPRLATASTSGVAFQDLNGNGIRDRDEPGFGGLVVRRDGQAVMADQQGRYRFAGAEAGPIEPDARSLPVGWVIGPAQPGSRTGADLPVVRLTPVRVDLLIAPSDSGRIPRAVLSDAILSVRGDNGQTWVARSMAPGQLVFDALPPGRYVLSLDLADVPEPLHPEGPLPVFEVGDARDPDPVTIVLAGRPVRVGGSASRRATSVDSVTAPAAAPPSGGGLP